MYSVIHLHSIRLWGYYHWLTSFIAILTSSTILFIRSLMYFGVCVLSFKVIRIARDRWSSNISFLSLHTHTNEKLALLRQYERTWWGTPKSLHIVSLTPSISFNHTTYVIHYQQIWCHRSTKTHIFTSIRNSWHKSSLKKKNLFIWRKRALYYFFLLMNVTNLSVWHTNILIHTCIIVTFL